MHGKKEYVMRNLWNISTFIPIIAIKGGNNKNYSGNQVLFYININHKTAPTNI